MNAPRTLTAVLPGLLILAALSAKDPNAGVIGWYNGEWQSGIPGVGNWYLAADKFSRAYDAFDVPEEGWTVFGVFSDNALYEFHKVNHASWEIRRDMAPGQGGRVVASGISRATQMPDPWVTAARYPAGEAAMHFRIQVEGLHLRLRAGRYWLSVAPLGQGQSILSATRGAHAVGREEGPTGVALVSRSGYPSIGRGLHFAPADALGRGGQAGICQHFAQGVIIAK